jgi:hypothetical protein
MDLSVVRDWEKRYIGVLLSFLLIKYLEETDIMAEEKNRRSLDEFVQSNDFIKLIHDPVFCWYYYFNYYKNFIYKHRRLPIGDWNPPLRVPSIFSKRISTEGFFIEPTECFLANWFDQQVVNLKYKKISDPTIRHEFCGFILDNNHTHFFKHLRFRFRLMMLFQ